MYYEFPADIRIVHDRIDKTDNHILFILCHRMSNLRKHLKKRIDKLRFYLRHLIPVLCLKLVLLILILSLKLLDTLFNIGGAIL